MIRAPLRRLLPLALLSAAVAAESGPPPSVPRVSHPGAGQTIYFLLTDRFENGSAANDRGGETGGDRQTHGFDPTSIQYYHGGDFAGLVSRLDYIKSLGATAIWVTPPFRNKVVQGTTGSYHGYWIVDFLSIDPHLGGDADFRAFVVAAHARGLKVICDIVVNHTANVINATASQGYVSKSASPYRDATGQIFDDRAFAFNGLGDASFPALATATSFPHVPRVAAGEGPKSPAWLNDLTNYHNRGDSSYTGEDYNYGEISGLDDLFTEKPEVVRGMIDIYTYWITNFGLDGFRIDTVKHVGPEFWQAFAPAMRAAARAVGRSDFLQFGEVFQGDPAYLSQWPTGANLDSVLDFGFAFAARDFVSKGQGSAAFANLFASDDLYTDHDSNVHSIVTFIGNHDLGRFGYFLRQDNASATDAQLLDLSKLGHGLMYLVRGQPVVYYGDEQGMIGSGGDSGAREDMFATQASAYANLARIGTTAKGDVAKFDESHPLFQTFRTLAALRAGHPALSRGAMIARASPSSSVFAFSRIERRERVEYLVAANNARGTSATVALPTSQPAGAVFRRIFDSRTPADAGDEILTIDAQGRATAQLAPLQLAVWRAETALPSLTAPPTIAFATPRDGATLTFSAQTTEGQTFPSRVELRADVTGAADFGEVTFALTRADRPNQFEILGVDDAPPYRVFWRPPADLAAGAPFTLVATVDNLRGGRASTQIAGLTFNTTGGVTLGIKGSATPAFVTVPAAASVFTGSAVTLRAAATGTPPLTYQWLKDGEEISGATAATLTLPVATLADAGSYAVLARNLAGTTMSAAATVQVEVSPFPTVTAQPASATVAPGGSVTFRVTATATSALSYQWTKNGQPIAGATSATLTLGSLSTANNGDYAVIVTAGGNASVTSARARLLVATPNPGRLINLSVRSRAGSGAETLIAGFVIGGSSPKRLLVRGIGPTLGSFGVSGALRDPRLALFRQGVAAAIATNDDWLGDAALAAAFARTGAFALPPTSADAAMLASLAPAGYTAQVRGADPTPGTALVEIYDDDAASGARLTNLSARSVVGADTGVLIAGFVINGNVPVRLLVRGIGPTLTDFGLAGVLTDPQLALFNEGQATPLASNDDWGGGAALASAFAEAGAFALAPASRDAALSITLVPGAYTAQVSGVGGATGVALVEIYELPALSPRPP